MYVIAKKKFLFQDEDVVMDQQSGVNVAVVKKDVVDEVEVPRSFTIAPSPNPQFAPDWIKTTALYKLAAKDKSIMGVTVDEGDEPDAGAPVAPPATGWGQPTPALTTAPQGTLKSN